MAPENLGPPVDIHRRPKERLLAFLFFARRPALLAHLTCLSRKPPGLVQRPSQQELDLSVRAAQFVARPPGQSVVHGGIKPQQYALALAHRVTVLPSLVQRAGVDDLLSGLLAA
jgi:hypothetical protein